MSVPPGRRIVIVGGGIIGCTSAYYLTRHPSFDISHAHITLIEASSIAEGASGKAGGLVAKWAYPRELAVVSFAEHTRLAQEHDGVERWRWRKLACGHWEGRACTPNGPGIVHSGMGQKASKSMTTLPQDLDWIEESLTDVYQPIAGPEETAQVHPYQFTTSMLALAREQAGEKLVVITHARVTSIQRGSAGEGSGERVLGVTYNLTNGEVQHDACAPADTIILAAGPWSPTLLPSLPITTTRAHSIVIQPTSPLSPYALFTSICDPVSGDTATPEIYARPQNRLYACGSGDDMPLPALASLVEKSPSAIAVLREQVGAISPVLRDGAIEVEQACYLPLGGPIVGRVEDVRGLVVATGHTCWGICNAPGTGKAVAELVMDGSLSETWSLRKLEPRFFCKTGSNET